VKLALWAPIRSREGRKDHAGVLAQDLQQVHVNLQVTSAMSLAGCPGFAGTNVAAGASIWLNNNTAAGATFNSFCAFTVPSREGVAASNRRAGEASPGWYRQEEAGPALRWGRQPACKRQH
jgi:hypothetical protein